jgi:lipoate---protein ligase
VADDWIVEHHRGSAQELHDLEPGREPGPAIWVCEPVRPALVLGSAQRNLELDAAPLAGSGLDVARRRSGGGVVLVDPERTLWIDMVIPVGHSLWVDDVGRAMGWVGDTWSRALASLGVESAVHRGKLDQRRWGRIVCVAGLGPGEVVDGRGRKLVGISQRRTRRFGRFQTVVALADPVVDLASVLGLAGSDAASLRAELIATTALVPFARSVVIEAVITSLPR